MLTPPGRLQVGEASRVKLMFVGICLLEVVANFDAGVLPASASLPVSTWCIFP